MRKLVYATKVQVGDTVIDVSTEDYVVKEIRRVKHESVPADIRVMGGWVVLAGVLPNGSEEDYYAYPNEMIVVERAK